MRKELNMKPSLFKEIKRNIEFKFQEDQMTKNIQGFIEELPLNLQSLVQLSIH